MVQLAAPYSIGEHVYFLLGNTITEGIVIACTVQLDHTGHRVTYEVGYNLVGPSKCQANQGDLYARRIDVVNSLLHNSETLDPKKTKEIIEEYHIERQHNEQPEPETEPTASGIMAEVAQRWREQMFNQPEPVEL